MRLGLRTRILGLAGAVVLAAMAAVVATTSLLAAREYEAALASRSVAIAKGLQLQLERVLGFGLTIDQLTGFEEQCQQVVSTYPGIAYAVVRDAHGKLLFASAGAPEEAGRDASADKMRLLSGQDLTERVQGATGVWHEAVVPVLSGEPYALVGSLAVGFGHDIVAAKVRQLLMSSLVAGLVVLAMGLVVLRIMLGAFVTKRLRELIDTITGLRQRPLDLTRRARVRANDELGRLGRVFNELMDDLEQTTVGKGELEAAMHELRGVSDALHEQKERAEVTLRSIADAVLATDAEGRVVYLNPAAEALTGHQASEVTGQPVGSLLTLVRSGTRETVPDPLRALRSGSSPPRELGDELDLVRPQGDTVAVDLTAALIHDRDGAHAGGVLTLRDVSAERSLAQRRNWEATHDPLTGLVNRREFTERVEAALATARSDGGQNVVCFLDLDRFKVVNDTCGHNAGDELLKTLAALMGERVRRSDTLARLGGDEFALLLPGCSVERAQLIANDLLSAVRDYRFEHKGKTFDVGVSIGLAPGGADHTTPEVLSMADTACYWAKEHGRNRVCVYHVGDTDMAARRREVGWVARLNAALEDERFVLYHQSYLALDTAGGRGRRHLEVLLRMVDEDGQLVQPGSFLPAAERYGLMPRIDRWVITQVCAGYAELAAQSAGVPLTCAINLSGTTLNGEGLLEFVREQMQRHAVPADALCFEITETAAINNLKAAAVFVADCRALGIRFALDDFGTGTSSFGYLKSLQVDYLKIDGGFVRNLHADRIDRAMTQMINHMGHVMGIKTVAEYAENDAIIDELRAIGVDYAQGYGVQVPEPLFKRAPSQQPRPVAPEAQAPETGPLALH